MFIQELMQYQIMMARINYRDLTKVALCGLNEQLF